ncbi:MAG: chemotaxis protein [Geobacteraceae bacterium GWB2_52_12]|nr:MAG: chemotaxis protein [Geobacteraceae bacterium GWB2_52_12]
MIVKAFKNWGIFYKIMSLSLTTSLLLILATMFLLVPFIRELIMKEKQATVSNLVQEATSVVASYNKQVEAGTLTKEEAQKQAAERIAAVRYNEKDYIWINDLNPNMVMHPYKPELNGKDLSQTKDPKGKFLFMEMVKVCKEKGKGFVEYAWEKPGSSSPMPKLSYVELFQPWGWVIGTGIYVDDVDAQMMKIIIGIGVALCILLALTIMTTLFIARSITVPASVLAAQTAHVARGELNVDVSCSSNDEIGQLARSFKTMAESLRSIISRVAETSTQVAAAAGQLNATSGQIAAGAEEIASQTTTVATAGEEMSATSGDIAQNCQMAAEGAKRASQSAQNGSAVVAATITVMSQIAEKVQESAKTVERLGARSEQIGNIIGTIEDIADQTNLLALNAAIEAARAGEQGRGFAVVADEVRALAERTTRATKEIGEMIKAIQIETKGAVAAMEQGVQQVEAGTIEASKSGAALSDILGQINDVAMQVNQIATAAEEQTATTSEISSNMQQITEVVLRTSHGAHESATAAAQLNGNAEELQRLVRQFKL